MKPLVSICCITYNQVNYIRNSLEGFISQKTDFSFEILIFDDASTDGTQDIIREYASKHNNIKTFLQVHNQWANQKYGLLDWLFPSAQGKYIAICEGDDYWTDPSKLQKQVDLLESNPSHSGCFCNTIYVNKDNHQVGICTRVPQGIKTIQFEEMVQRFMLHTPSFMFKRAAIDPRQLELIIKNSPYGDLPLVLHCLLQGEIGYLNENMAAYRVNVGIMQTWNDFKGLEDKVKVLLSFKTLSNLTKTQLHAINWAISFNCLNLAKSFAPQQASKSLRYYLLFWKHLPGYFLMTSPKLKYLGIKDIFRPLKYLIIKPKLS